MKNRKAISPVIATVILVAVAITIAVAVSYWMSGISSSYTKFEKIEIQTAVCNTTATGWTVALTLKNTGTSAATINNVFVNDNISTLGTTAANTTLTEIGSTVASAGTSIDSGSTTTVYVFIGSTFSSSGTAINIKLHSAGGMDYIKLVELV